MTQISTLGDEASREIFSRAIRASQLVVAGDFESALEGIIETLERPPGEAGTHRTASDLIARTARAMRQGFAGLPPNGFDFSLWLWDAAPLHTIVLPQANSIGSARGHRYGVVHLRTLAAETAELYLHEQPELLPAVVELIDSSVGWVDARNLVSRALLRHYLANVDAEFPALQAMLAGTRVWRKLIPLGVAARLLATQPERSADALALAALAVDSLHQAPVNDAMRYLLRIGGMYGDQEAVLRFVSDLCRHGAPGTRALICEFVRNPRLRWERIPRARVAAEFRSWLATGGLTDPSCLERAIARLEAEDAPGE